jgi:hypothetical protein
MNIIDRYTRWRARRTLAKHRRWERRLREREVILPKPRADGRDWQRLFNESVRT